MRLLVLNRFPLASVRYRQWIGEHDLWLVTQRSSVPPGGVPDRDGYADVVVLDDYQSPRTELAAHELHERARFDGVVALSEFDLIRAARLRQAWGLDGQRPAEVAPYRDKLVMKEVLRECGVPVADHARVDGVTDLVAFVGRAGYPIVVKPRRGASSVGVRVLHGPEDLAAFLGPGSPLDGDTPPDMLVEEFVPNEMFNVDGIVLDGAIRVCWPSVTSSCLAFSARDHLIAAALDEQEPRRTDLQELVSATVRALPTPANSIFHAEVFATPDGRLLLNEIGCRIGGAKVRDLVELAFGVDLVEWYLRHTHGSGAERFRPPPVPRTQSGYALVPPRPGTVRCVPASCPLPGVAVYEPRSRVGDRLHAPASSIDAMAAIAVVGPSRAAVTSRLRDAASWIDSRIEVTP